MKRHVWLALAAAVACALTAWAVGCSKKEEETAPPPPPPEALQPAPPRQQEQEPQRQEEQNEVRQEGKKPNSPGLLTAPVDYMEAVTVTAPRHARKTVALAELRREIGQFEALNERYPASLEELAQWRGGKLPDLPPGKAYSYDPKTGKLEIVDQQ